LERIGDLCAICIAHVSGDAHDRVVALIDCGDGLVVRVVNVGEEGARLVSARALAKESAGSAIQG